MTRRLPATPKTYQLAFEILKSGGLVALPTETVYGLAASAADKKAVERLYHVKDRSNDKPLALCVDSFETAQKYAHLSGLGLKLAKAFWPGPLSLVLDAQTTRPLSPNLYGLGDDGQATISLRWPDTEWIKFLPDLPLALTSANVSGQSDPRNGDDVYHYLSGKIELIIDETTPLSSGQASTIISISGKRAKLLRRGALSHGDFAKFDIDWA